MFSNKELQGKSCNDIQDMLVEQKGINWNDYPAYKKRGTCVVKEDYYVQVDSHSVAKEIPADEVEAFTGKLSVRTRWKIDKNIPMFKEEGRAYIEKLILNVENN